MMSEQIAESGIASVGYETVFVVGESSIGFWHPAMVCVMCPFRLMNDGPFLMIDPDVFWLV